MTIRNKNSLGKDTSFFDKYNIAVSEFPEQCQVLINVSNINNLFFVVEGDNVVEYSFNGFTVHGDLTPDSTTSSLYFPNRSVNKIWFRAPNGPSSVRVEAYSGDVFLNNMTSLSLGSTGDISGPVVSSIVIPAGGQSIVITMNEDLDESSVPDTGDFSLSGTTASITNVSVVGSVITLTLDEIVFGDVTVNISYTAGVNPIRDLVGNNAANFNNLLVTNNSELGLFASWESGLGYTFNNPILDAEGDFSDTAWVKTNCTVSGTTGNQTITADGSGVSHIRQVASNVDSSRDNTIVAVVSPGNQTWVRLLDSFDTTNNTAYFDVQNGVVGTLGAGVLNADIIDVGSGQYRCRVKFVASSSIQPRVQIANADGDSSVAGGDSIILHSVEVVNGKVSTWTDQQSGRTLSESTASLQPWVDPFGGPKGELELTFDDGIRRLISDDPASDWNFLHEPSPGASSYVSFRATAANNDMYILSTRDATGTGIRLTADVDNERAFSQHSDGFGNTRSLAITSGSVLVDNTYVMSYRSGINAPSGAQVELQVDTGLDDQNLIDWTAGGSDAEFTLYLGDRPGGGRPFVGAIGSVKIYQGRPDDTTHAAERAAMELQFSLQVFADWQPGLGYTFNNPTLTASTDFNDVAWTKINTTITTDATSGPTGGTFADRIETSSTASNCRIRQEAGNIDTARDYVFEIIAKADTVNWMRLRDEPAGMSIYFDIVNGTIGTASNVLDSSIEDAGNGFYLCRVKIAAAAQNYVTIATSPADNDAPDTTGQSIYVYSAAVVNGKVATWTDQANGRTVTAPSAAEQPWVDPFGVPEMNDLLVPTGSVASDTLLLSDDSASVWTFLHDGSPCAIYTADRQTAQSTFHRVVATLADGAGATGLAITFNSSGNRQRWLLRNSSNEVLDIEETGNRTLGDVYVSSYRCDASDSPDFVINTYAEQLTEDALTSFSTSDPGGSLAIFNAPNSQSSFGFEGQIGRVLIYSDKPADLFDATKRAELEAQFGL